MRRAERAEHSGGVEVLATVRGAPPAARVRAWTRRLLSKAGAKRASLSVLLCGDARMRSLNRHWRGLDRATDVLSFSPFEESSLSRAVGRRTPFLGDLVIDVRYAARQARRRGHSPGREVQILLAHGLLLVRPCRSLGH